MPVDQITDDPFVNRVAQSGLITIDLKELLPAQPIESFDLAPLLFMGMVLKEKDYREALKNTDWSKYANKVTAVYCSADAIIPVWAYMLAATYLQQVGAKTYFGTPGEVKRTYLQEGIYALNPQVYAGQRIIIKGCADDNITEQAYVAITARLLPVVKSLMYGEACSNVPLYKQKSQAPTTE